MPKVKVDVIFPELVKSVQGYRFERGLKQYEECWPAYHNSVLPDQAIIAQLTS